MRRYTEVDQEKVGKKHKELVVAALGANNPPVKEVIAKEMLVGPDGSRGASSLWWITWRVPVHYAADDVAGEHRYTMWWMTWRAQVHYPPSSAT